MTTINATCAKVLELLGLTDPPRTEFDQAILAELHWRVRRLSVWHYRENTDPAVAHIKIAEEILAGRYDQLYHAETDRYLRERFGVDSRGRANLHMDLRNRLRSCLRCQKKFLSQHRGHRMCDRCREKGEYTDA